MARRLLPLLVILFFAACETEPPTTGVEIPQPSHDLVDGTTMGNPHFFFEPPLVPDPTANGTFDGTLDPRVEICEWTGAACVPGDPAFTFTTTSGSGGETVQVSLDDEHYGVNWDTQAEGVDPGDVFRITVFLVSLELGSVDVEIGENGGEVRNINTGDNIGLVDRRTVPIRFRIEEGAIGEEEAQAEQECLDASGNVIDCDVVVVEADDGGSATVNDDPGGGDETLAAIVTIDPGDAVDANGDPVDFVLTLEHVTTEPAPPEDIPTDQQVPFFIDVTAEDADGNAVFFQTGADLVLCQPPDLGDDTTIPFIENPLHQFLKIFQVRSGVTDILPTTVGGTPCPGELHGGLNGLVGSFSGFGATLPTDPSASTAVVPNGTVGSPTVIDIQAKVDATNNQVLGGDDVEVTVSGANSATLTVGAGIVDNGDGTYTATYTPGTAGTDAIAIEIRNVETGNLEPISGSPFTSVVAAPGGVVIDGVLSTGEWNAAVSSGIPVSLPGGGQTTATVYLMNDATNLYAAVDFDADLSSFGVHTVAVRLDENPVNDEWDEGGDGNGDDGWVAQHQGVDSGVMVDEHFNATAGQGQRDDAKGGTNDGATAFEDDGSSTVVEMSHPLNSGDFRDAELAACDTYQIQIFTTIAVALGDPSETSDLIPAWSSFLVEPPNPPCVF